MTSEKVDRIMLHPILYGNYEIDTIWEMIDDSAAGTEHPMREPVVPQETGGHDRRQSRASKKIS